MTVTLARSRRSVERGRRCREMEITEGGIDSGNSGSTSQSVDLTQA